MQRLNTWWVFRRVEDPLFMADEFKQRAFSINKLAVLFAERGVLEKEFVA
jgi:hypothetical protein